MLHFLGQAVDGALHELFHGYFRDAHALGDGLVRHIFEAMKLEGGASPGRQGEYGDDETFVFLLGDKDPFGGEVVRQIRGGFVPGVLEPIPANLLLAVAADENVARNLEEVALDVLDRIAVGPRLEPQEHLLHQVVRIIRAGAPAEEPPQARSVVRHPGSKIRLSDG